ncbi:MAG: GNAT family N-acetyltransferase [Nanoarchaeota archaeon]|nr:GNAT family N-acetyltransferase [Nanoarchaeota archaeon]
MSIKFIQYQPKYHYQVYNLIKSILDSEYAHVICAGKYGDLDKIEENYIKDGGIFWLALDNNTVIGTIALRNYGLSRGLVKRMYVKKEYRRQGIGKRLMKTLLDFARKNNYTKLYLGTTEDMEDAIRFYSKMGFKKIKSLPKDIPECRGTVFFEYSI